MSDSPDPAITELGTQEPDAERPVVRRHSPEEDEAIRAFSVEAARLMTDLHCEHVIILDVRGRSEITDYIIVASGTSDRQIRSVASDVQVLAKEHGLTRFGRDEDGPSTWVVLDFVDVIAHLFEPNARAHYDLEMMWGDAPEVTWRR